MKKFLTILIGATSCSLCTYAQNGYIDDYFTTNKYFRRVFGKTVYKRSFQALQPV